MLPSQLRKVGAGRLLQFPGLILSMDTGGMSAGCYGATTPQLSKTLILTSSIKIMLCPGTIRRDSRSPKA